MEMNMANTACLQLQCVPSLIFVLGNKTTSPPQSCVAHIPRIHIPGSTNVVTFRFAPASDCEAGLRALSFCFSASPPSLGSRWSVLVVSLVGVPGMCGKKSPICLASRRFNCSRYVYSSLSMCSGHAVCSGFDTANSFTKMPVRGLRPPALRLPNGRWSRVWLKRSLVASRGLTLNFPFEPCWALASVPLRWSPDRFTDISGKERVLLMTDLVRQFAVDTPDCTLTSSRPREVFGRRLVVSWLSCSMTHRKRGN